MNNDNTEKLEITFHIKQRPNNKEKKNDFDENKNSSIKIKSEKEEKYKSKNNELITPIRTINCDDKEIYKILSDDKFIRR